MKAEKINPSKTLFLKRIATFDWERYYTSWARFACHLSMWLVFTSLLQLNLFLDSDLPINQAAAFAIRTLLCNMAVFYLFFYVVVPITLLKNRIIMTLVSFIVCVVLWIFINHYCLVFIATNFNVQAPYYTRGLKSNLKATIWYIISPRNIFVLLIPVFYSISPFFFTKIVVSIMRFYSTLFNWERKATYLEMEKLNLEREKLNLEKDFLKSQLNPHFLFNTLNNLYGLSIDKDDTAPEVITQLSEIMRYTLYESNAEKVPLAKELRYLQSYVLLEKMRHNYDTDIEIKIDNADADHHLITPLLTFTFVENAFKYGLKKRNGSFLKIRIAINLDVFYFSIINDKQEKQKSAKFGGIGLENAKKRLKLLYPGKHTLNIEDRGQTFNVELTINLN